MNTARRTLERALVWPTPQEVEAARQTRLGWAREPQVVFRPGGGKIGVVPVHGSLFREWCPEVLILGGTVLEEFDTALDALRADDAVTEIVLHVDSPGFRGQLWQRTYLPPYFRVVRAGRNSLEAVLAELIGGKHARQRAEREAGKLRVLWEHRRTVPEWVPQAVPA